MNRARKKAKIKTIKIFSPSLSCLGAKNKRRAVAALPLQHLGYKLLYITIVCTIHNCGSVELPTSKVGNR